MLAWRIEGNADIGSGQAAHRPLYRVPTRAARPPGPQLHFPPVRRFPDRHCAPQKFHPHWQDDGNAAFNFFGFFPA